MVSSCIARVAAIHINFHLWELYDLVTMKANANEWLRWTNATLAAYEVMTRRGAQATKSMLDKVLDLRRQLREIRDMRGAVPDGIFAVDWLPAVTNYEVERWRDQAPVRVVPFESTREAPSPGIKRNTATPSGGYFV
jgi:hypothetical protein